MDVNNRYCYDDAVVNYGVVELSQADVIRQTLYEYLYTSGSFKAYVDKAFTFRRIGKDTKCLDERVRYLQALVELFVIIKLEQTCTTEDNYEEIKEEYKLDCIRDILACRYGLGNLVDELVDMLGLTGAKDGIGYMTIQAPDAEADCSPFQPTDPNN